MLTRTGMTPPWIDALRDPALKRAAWLAAGYIAWIAVFRLLALTFVTYIVTSSGTQAARFEDVSEAMSSNELWLTALGSLLFLGVTRLLNPLPDPRNPLTSSRLSGPGLKRYLGPGIAQGAILGIGVVAACLLSGVYHYLGFFVHFEQSLLAAGNVLLRVASLVVFVYCEERIFRDGILLSLREASSNAGTGLARPYRFAGPIAAALLTSVAFVLAKSLQFELGTMHYITLTLASLALSLRALAGRNPMEGAGLWGALLLVFHPLFGLPVLGNEFSGIILIKYQAADDGAFALSEWMRFLTGGAGGPLSGFALQFLLILDMIRTGLRLRRVDFVEPTSYR